MCSEGSKIEVRVWVPRVHGSWLREDKVSPVAVARAQEVTSSTTSD